MNMCMFVFVFVLKRGFDAHCILKFGAQGIGHQFVLS